MEILNILIFRLHQEQLHKNAAIGPLTQWRSRLKFMTKLLGWNQTCSILVQRSN
jgi:hypothetical protein